MLGWTDTQEQANNVARQLQMMFHIVRWSGQRHSCVGVLTMAVERGAAFVLVRPVRTCEKRRMDNIETLCHELLHIKYMYIMMSLIIQHRWVFY